MRKCLPVALVVLASSVAVQAEVAKPAPIPMLRPGELKWEDQQPLFPKGAQYVVVSGDPTQAAPFVVRLRLAPGYKIPPHWYATDQHMTVLKGIVAIGKGDKADPKELQDLPGASFVTVPANVHVFVEARTHTAVQIHGIGPLAPHYLNAADDPRNATAK